jgi:predicted aminopeptidase
MTAPLKYRVIPGGRTGVRALVSRLLLCAGLLLSSAGCATLQYYAQSISGQMDVLSRRRPIQAVLDDPTAPESLKVSLRTVQEITAFAREHLLLPDNGSYGSYAELGRAHVAWNVFAAPELSLEPLRWCFPVAGCLSYRGYFDRGSAEKFAARLQSRGYDVYVAPVAAYSTLGWFEDPVIDGMLRRTDLKLARLLFHELAHQKLYLSGDTEINEAFADAVALIGVEEWQAHFPDRANPAFQSELAAEESFVRLALAYRELLRGIYESGRADAEKRARKQALFAALRSDYETLKRSRGDAGLFDDWFASGPNNARLAALSTYRELVPLFIDAYRAADSSLELFYARVESLKSCDRNDRIRRLRNGPLPAACGTGRKSVDDSER